MKIQRKGDTKPYTKVMKIHRKGDTKPEKKKRDSKERRRDGAKTSARTACHKDAVRGVIETEDNVGDNDQPKTPSIKRVHLPVK